MPRRRVEFAGDIRHLRPFDPSCTEQAPDSHVRYLRRISHRELDDWNGEYMPPLRARLDTLGYSEDQIARMTVWSIAENLVAHHEQLMALLKG